MVEATLAPHRNWGLWVGSRSVIEPLDGALYVGGYDANRIDGEFTTFVGTSKCYSCAKVTNLTYTTNSQSVSLFNRDTVPFWVEISPGYNTISVPADVFENFQLFSNGTMGTDPGTTALLTFPNDAELGSLNITLQGGYSTTIPAREMFFPPRQFNEEGIYMIENNTYLVSTIVNSTAPDGIIPAWGIPFLTMNYMTMDFEWDTFSLAPARQGPYSDAEGPNVQLLCQTVTTGSPSPTASTLASSEPLPGESKTSSTNVGTTAGAVTGGVVGVLLIYFLIWLFMGRRSRKGKSQEDAYIAVADHLDHVPKQMVQVCRVFVASLFASSQDEPQRLT